MATAKDVLGTKKAKGVITAAPGCRVREACVTMRDHRIGALLVSEGDNLLGIFTERDVMNLVVAEGKDPETTTIADVMTRKILVVRPDRPVDEVEAIMRQERIRHVPVVDDRGLLGVISIGDLNAYRAAEDHQTVEYLQQYIGGRA